MEPSTTTNRPPVREAAPGVAHGPEPRASSAFIHGALTIHVPQGWLDASQIAFLEPAEDDLALEFQRRAAGAGGRAGQPVRPRGRSNFTLTVRPWFLSMDPVDFLQRELSALLAGVPGGRASALREVTLGQYPALLGTLELNHDGLAVKQLHAMAVGQNRLIHFCGTSNLGDFARAERRFGEILESIQIEP